MLGLKKNFVKFFFFGMKKTLRLIWTEKILCLEKILCPQNSTHDLLLFTQFMKNIHPHNTALWSNVYVYVRIRHERSAFQSVSVQAVDWHNDSGPLFSLFFSSTSPSSFLFFSLSQPFLFLLSFIYFSGFLPPKMVGYQF